MSDEVLLAASALSKSSNIPLSRIIAFIEGHSARAEKRLESAESRADKYAENTAASISRLERRMHNDHELPDIPASILDAYKSTVEF